MSYKATSLNRSMSRLGLSRGKTRRDLAVPVHLGGLKIRLGLDRKEWSGCSKYWCTQPKKEVKGAVGNLIESLGFGCFEESEITKQVITVNITGKRHPNTNN